MELIWLIIVLVITGVIFGALGRLAVPGPNPMGIGTTILAGIGGAFLGTIVGALLQLDPGTNRLIYFVLQVLGAALIVYALSRRGGTRRVYADDGGPRYSERRGFMGRGFGRRY
jgi:uncharacterized membrane protein YeaQ/YmgE (transglycosylase-associated protein family)